MLVGGNFVLVLFEREDLVGDMFVLLGASAVTPFDTSDSAGTVTSRYGENVG